MARPLVIGHRGSPLDEPENTLPSFRRALADGADAIELDVRTTADGRLVCFHDETLERTSGDEGELASSTLEKLSSLSLERRGHIAALDEALALGARTMIDVKAADAGALAGAIDAADARGRVWVCSFDHLFLGRARELGLSPLGYLIRPGTMFTELEGVNRREDGLGFVLDPVGQEELVEIENLAIPAGSLLNVPHFMMINEPDFARKLVEHFHSRGINMNVWTVNEPGEVRALASIGVDGIITDRPGMAVETLKEM